MHLPLFTGRTEGCVQGYPKGVLHRVCTMVEDLWGGYVSLPKSVLSLFEHGTILGTLDKSGKPSLKSTQMCPFDPTITQYLVSSVTARKLDPDPPIPARELYHRIALPLKDNQYSDIPVTSSHIVSLLCLCLLAFILNPCPLLNTSHLVCLSLYYS